MLRIKLTVENEEDTHSVILEEKRELYPSIGDNELSALGEFINNFLKAYGYIGFDKSTILLQSLTDEEHDFLLQCLEDYRADKKD